jgi:putative transposase
MKRSRYSDEQIAYALRQADGGAPVADVCRQMGISEATFYIWKKKYANLGTSEIRELRQLRDENAKLKRLVADLTLDKHILGEIIRKKKSKAGTQARARRVGSYGLRGEFLSRVSADADLEVTASLSLTPGHPRRSAAADA